VKHEIIIFFRFYQALEVQTYNKTIKAIENVFLIIHSRSKQIFSLDDDDSLILCVKNKFSLLSLSKANLLLRANRMKMNQNNVLLSFSFSTWMKFPLLFLSLSLFIRRHNVFFE
jgi:hypothetical protein